MRERKIKVEIVYLERSHFYLAEVEVPSDVGSAWVLVTWPARRLPAKADIKPREYLAGDRRYVGRAKAEDVVRACIDALYRLELDRTRGRL